MVVALVLSLAFMQGCQHMKARCLDCGKVVKVTTLRGINFDFDKSQIRGDGQSILQEDINLLKDNASLDVSIQGHTDSVGSPAYNKTLSVKRAKSVYNYLIQNGIPANRMTTVGLGESDPIVPNTNASNRALNRRVELHIIKARP